MIFGAKTGGYVGIVIKEGDISGLVNVLMAKNVPVWSMKKIESGVYFRIPLPLLPKVRHLSQSFGCYITVADRGGLPFFYRSITKSWRLWLTALFCFCLLLLFTASIWQVEITDDNGNTLTEKEAQTILETAADYGIRPMMLKRSVDYDAAAEAILAAHPSLAWVGFEIKGVTVTVRVAAKEKNDAHSVFFGHIVAAKNGVIRETFVLKGQKKVEVGDTVEAGDILISGLITYEEEGKAPVSDVTAAKGMIKAAVWYEGVAYVSLRGIEVTPTGKECGMVTISRDGKTYTLWGSEESPFDDAVTEEREMILAFGASIKVKNIAEVRAKEKQRTEEAAPILAKTQARAAAEAKLPKGVTVVDEHLKELTDENGAVGVQVILETEEDIGKFSPME